MRTTMKKSFFHSLPRFIYSIGFTLILTLILSRIDFTQNLNFLEKAIGVYNIFQWSYLILLLNLIFTSKTNSIKEMACKQDENANFVLILSSFASVITLITIAMELSSAKEAHGVLKTIHLALPAITLIGVWALLPTMYAVHYAHLYYLAKTDEERPMKFPDNPEAPDYFDFLYFSVTIAVASQTADVGVYSKSGRRLVLMQSILAFLFNTSVLALGINVAASLLN